MVLLCSLVLFLGWKVAAEDRPTFTELVSEFDKMTCEPQRYLCMPVCVIILNTVL